MAGELVDGEGIPLHPDQLALGGRINKRARLPRGETERGPAAWRSMQSGGRDVGRDAGRASLIWGKEPLLCHHSGQAGSVQTGPIRRPNSNSAVRHFQALESCVGACPNEAFSRDLSYVWATLGKRVYVSRSPRARHSSERGSCMRVSGQSADRPPRLGLLSPAGLGSAASLFGCD